MTKVDLDRTFQGEVARGQYAAELPEPCGLSRDRPLG